MQVSRVKLIMCCFRGGWGWGWWRCRLIPIWAVRKVRSSGWGWVEEVVFVAAEEEREAAEVVLEVVDVVAGGVGVGDEAVEGGVEGVLVAGEPCVDEFQHLGEFGGVLQVEVDDGHETGFPLSTVDDCGVLLVCVVQDAWLSGR